MKNCRKIILKNFSHLFCNNYLLLFIFFLLSRCWPIDTQTSRQQPFTINFFWFFIHLFTIYYLLWSGWLLVGVLLYWNFCCCLCFFLFFFWFFPFLCAKCRVCFTDDWLCWMDGLFARWIADNEGSNTLCEVNRVVEVVLNKIVP